MFARLLSITSLAILAVATPHSYDRRGSSQCDTGSLQCCQQTESADQFNSGMGGVLGVLVPTDILGSVGLGCSPISVIGLGSGASCAQQPVCCSNNKFNGLVNVGCTPINL